MERTIPLVKLVPCLEARAEWSEEILKKLLRHYRVSVIYNTPDGTPMLFPGVWATFRRGTHLEMLKAGCVDECMGMCRSQVDPKWFETTIYVKTTTPSGRPIDESEQLSTLIHEMFHLVDHIRILRDFRMENEEEAAVLYAALDVALEDVYFLEGINVIF